MPQFLFLGRGAAATPHSEVERLVGAEAAVVWQDVKDGSVQAMYYLEKLHGAVRVLDLPDRSAAEDFIQLLSASSLPNPSQHKPTTDLNSRSAQPTAPRHRE